ncbi:MAG: OmpA family protein [Bacteroidota bacterium]|nr:OmpA family protein [Bacteroidota bacterium]
MAALAQSPSRDTTVLRDTLVESRYTIEHSPLRGGFELFGGLTSYSNSNFQEPIFQTGCDRFDQGTGSDYGLRAMAEIPFWGDLSKWKFAPAISVDLRKAKFDWTQRAEGLSVDGNSLDTFTIQHEISATLSTVGIEGRFEYQVSPAFALHAGPAIGISITRSYSKTEHMTGAEFLSSHTQDTTLQSGSLSDKLTMLPSFSIAASYEVPLSRTLRAAPNIELDYHWLVAGRSALWSGIDAKAGVSLMFDLTPRLETVPTFVKSEVPVVIHREPEVAPLTASIEAVAVGKSGKESKVVRMTIEEVRTRNAYPILNYIFFDDGSSIFPSRYLQFASFDEASRSFRGSTERQGVALMDLYRETLNILGDRLRKHPKAQVTLIGSTSGNERGGLSLAHARVNRVKDYLVRVWQIDPTKIRCEATLLPERPSPVTTAEGQAENRRVEFRVDDERVNDPIVVTNIEHLATPDQIRLKPSVSRPDILRTHASIQAGGVEFQSFNGDAKSSTTEKLWAPTEELLSKLSDSLSIEYDVTDSAGHHAHAHSAIPLDIQRVTSDREERVERFSLILFGFDESRVERRNDREVRRAADMIAHIPVQRVLVQGFTDETGDAAHNDQLSQDRATQIADRLKIALKDEKAAIPGDLHTEGRGSHDLLYDNRLPEGRFFSRTVNITIERAVK